MTVLSADANIQSKDLPTILSYPVEDNVKIYKGAIVAIDTSGYATNAADTASFVVVGIADEDVDNTVSGHTAGGLNIRVVSGRAFLLTAASMTQAKVGAEALVSDDATVVTSGTTNSIKVGRVVSYVSATQVWVYIPIGGPGN
jgi:hypothetical protein